MAGLACGASLLSGPGALRFRSGVKGIKLSPTSTLSSRIRFRSSCSSLTMRSSVGDEHPSEATSALERADGIAAMCGLPSLLKGMRMEFCGAFANDCEALSNTFFDGSLADTSCATGRVECCDRALATLGAA